MVGCMFHLIFGSAFRTHPSKTYHAQPTTIFLALLDFAHHSGHATSICAICGSRLGNQDLVLLLQRLGAIFFFFLRFLGKLFSLPINVLLLDLAY